MSTSIKKNGRDSRVVSGQVTDQASLAEYIGSLAEVFQEMGLVQNNQQISWTGLSMEALAYACKFNLAFEFNQPLTDLMAGETKELADVLPAGESLSVDLMTLANRVRNKYEDTGDTGLLAAVLVIHALGYAIGEEGSQALVKTLAQVVSGWLDENMPEGKSVDPRWLERIGADPAPKGDTNEEAHE